MSIERVQDHLALKMHRLTQAEARLDDFQFFSLPGLKILFLPSAGRVAWACFKKISEIPPVLRYWPRTHTVQRGYRSPQIVHA